MECSSVSKRKRKHVPSEPRDRGTPETRAKLRKGTLENLVTRGKVDGPMLQAADEIAWVFSGITDPVAARVMNLDRVDGSRSGMTETEYFAIAHHDHFIPWMNEYSKKFKRSNRDRWQKVSITSIVLDLLSSTGVTASDIDFAHRWRNGSTVDLFIEGLEGYAKQAKMVRR